MVQSLSTLWSLATAQARAAARSIEAQLDFHAGVFTAGLIVGMCLPRFIQMGIASYRGFLALGPGGLPHNLAGWLVQGAVSFIATSDTTSTAPFRTARARRSFAPHGGRSFLDDGFLPLREGARPTVPSYVAPQRQTTDVAAPGAAADMVAFLRRVAAANPAALACRPSRLEGQGTLALWLAGPLPVPRFMRRTAGETCHVHPEGSTHLILSLADAELAAEKGWAERHRVSGVMGFWPVTYLLVYAPRDEAEMEVWKKLVMASLRFVCAGLADVKTVE